MSDISSLSHEIDGEKGASECVMRTRTVVCEFLVFVVVEVNLILYHTYVIKDQDII